VDALRGARPRVLARRRARRRRDRRLRGLRPEPPGIRELYFVYLRNEFHGQGLGQRLFDAVLEPGPAFLWIASDSPAAHRFYERNGFHLDGAEHIEPFLGEQIHEVRFIR
jgi:GNAT superfamily N-acetyltransferase